MAHLHLTNRLLAFAVATVLAASLANWAFTIRTISAASSSSRSRDASQIARNSRTLHHLCTLQTITADVWVSAIHSYATLPNKTPDQAQLLRELRVGVAQTQSDRTCPAIIRGEP